MPGLTKEIPPAGARQRTSPTRRVEVHLGYEPCGTRLTVENFAMNTEPPDVTSGGSGYGLTGMRERAELLGGDLTTAMTRGGFRVELRVPA